LRNLRFAFGKEKGEDEIVSLARKNFQQFGMIACEWARLKYITKGELQELVNIEGKEHLIAAKKKSPAVILLGAHFGNWEYAHLLYASTINRLNFIVRAIDIPFIEKERVAVNENFGVGILYQKNGLRPAIRNLKKGEDLVLFADRQAGSKEGITCQFFGKETSTLTLVPTLAKRFHIPIVPMFIIRSKDRVHHRIVFFPATFSFCQGFCVKISMVRFPSLVEPYPVIGVFSDYLFNNITLSLRSVTNAFLLVAGFNFEFRKKNNAMMHPIL
jgi:KDO2-lipid IV(A) lauroyltransferase